MTRQERGAMSVLADKARIELRKAVKNGTIKKPIVCSKCGRTFLVHEIHGHHPNYSKPLDVVWCCQGCHYKIENFLRFMDRTLEWWKYCAEHKLDAACAHTPRLHKKTGLPSGTTYLQHWLTHDYRPFSRLPSIPGNDQ